MNQQTILSQASEDYLKAIYQLSATHGLASTNQIAEALDVKPASVTNMLQKLSQMQPPLVIYHKHRGAELTAAGEKSALEVIRHHRLLETFLHDSLGYGWDAVHDEACRLEHVISAQFEDSIARELGEPAYDPHGDPIPDRDLKMPPHATTPLTDLLPGQQATIRRVPNHNPDLLRYLSQIGIRPETRVHVVDKSPFDDNLNLQINGQNDMHVLGPNIAGQIFVEIDSREV